VISGFADTLQHTPRSVTELPPSELMLPPLIAVVFFIDVTTEVEMVGKLLVGPFSRLTSFWQLKKANDKSRVRYRVFMRRIFVLINV